ncbi:hypothetical protein MLD38_023296 [Melastoma candidum]|uniref:Uncharacterized protein n=1 Tax=Melastoma candidum TaxID=119954 RepID=A0ACB9QLZ5_9MYRT|nr:hypothetical protein MLD38_023296 [Melastoma candidum]
MSSLHRDILLRMLEEMNNEETGFEDRKPALLQITSIVPLLGEGNLWPNQGFSLRVSDASHAMYVSLPQEQDDLILGNVLHIGQFVYADRMEASYPVPVLKGIRPAPGRHYLQVGAIKDLGSSLDNLVEISGTCDPGSLKYIGDDLEDAEKPKPKPKPRAKSHSSSAPMLGIGCNSPGRVGGRLWRDHRSSDSELIKGMDKGSDSDSTVSTDSTCSQISKRRSWNGVDDPRQEEILASRFLRHKLRPVAMSHPTERRSLSTRLLQGGSSGSELSPSTLRKELVLASKSHKISKCRSAGTPKRHEVSTDPASSFSRAPNRKRDEDGIARDSLPSKLVNLGKEVLKQRDAAMIAAAEAMQEAVATDRLVRCLSAFTELQSACSEDEQLQVDKFFSLQDDLIYSKSILQSLKTQDNDTDSIKSNKEASRVARDRKRNAKLWVEAAVKADLHIPSNIATKPVEEAKRSGGREQTCREKSREWHRGDSLVATSGLAAGLQTQLRGMFLKYLEQYLDRLRSELRTNSNTEMVGAMLRIKRVSDWLDMMVKKEAEQNGKPGSKDSGYGTNGGRGGLGESEIQAYGRVRNKIYRIMLKQIEKSAAALEGTY